MVCVADVEQSGMLSNEGQATSTKLRICHSVIGFEA